MVKIPSAYLCDTCHNQSVDIVTILEQEYSTSVELSCPSCQAWWNIITARVVTDEQFRERWQKHVTCQPLAQRDVDMNP